MRPSTRRLIQLYSALLHNAHLKGFIEGEIYQGKAKYACVPGFNCYSCPGAVGACPLGSIQNALASTGHRAGWYVMGIILLFGVILGRTICGWLCPLGLIQELLHKVPTFKIRKSPLTRALSWLKYIVLAVFVAAIPLWYGLQHDIPVPGFCKYICPAGTLEGAIGLLSNPGNADLFSMLGILFTRKFTIMLIIGLACVFCYRSFCRFLCPLGAIYGLFNRFSLVGVRVDENRCNNCGACVRNCGMDIRHVGDHECIHCASCVDSCPQAAISFKAGSAVLKPPARALNGEEAGSRRKKGRIAWGAALCVLCAALVWFNFLDPAVRAETKAKPEKAEQTAQAVSGGQISQTTPTPTAESIQVTSAKQDTQNVPAAEDGQTDHAVQAGDNKLAEQAATAVGSEVGMQLEDFTVTCFDGSEFSLADTRGKVVFINLWATYCTPCVQELPHFEALYQEHEGDIAMLAVHSSIVTDDPAAFVESKGWTIPFATDTDDDAIWGIVDGSSTLPQTIVLDRNGTVIYNQKGSVTPEMLAGLYAQAAGE